MKDSRKLIIFVLVVVIAIFVWVPWMDDSEDAVRKVINERAPQGFQECDGGLYVTWVPFGRWVTNCESGWYVTFWGSVL